MATISGTQSPPERTDVQRIWEHAIQCYNQATGTKIQSLDKAKNLDEVLREIQDKRTIFGKRRHGNSKTDKFRTLVKNTLQPIDKFSEIIANASSNTFPPAMAIFTAVRYLIITANNVSADYDKVIEFFDEVREYIGRLQILETHVTAELECTITEILTSVLVLFGITAKYIRKKRFAKAVSSFFKGEDDELESAFSHFRKMVDQERDIVRNITYVEVQKWSKRNVEIWEHLQRRDAKVDREAFLAELSSLSFETKQRDTYRQHSEGTGEWMLSSGEFQQWFHNVHSSTIWCHGIPGSGKTVLTSIAVNYVSTNTEGSNVAVVYLYFDYKNDKTHSMRDLLSNIARQLASHCSRIPQLVREFRDKHADKRVEPNDKDWITLIRQLLRLFRKAYIFIDALDECPEESRDKFLPLVQQLESSAHLFFTSRLMDVPIRFSNLVSIEVSAEKSDVKKYLESEIDSRFRLRKLAASNPGLKEDIVECLVKNTEGMFLLAHLQLDFLCEHSSARQIRQAMNTLPRNLEGFYSEAMLRIKNQNEDSQTTEKALSFIFCAKRPLTVDELCHALAVQDQDCDFNKEGLTPHEVLLSNSAGLIRLDEQSKIIRLAHHTLHEYFEKHPHKLLPSPDTEIARVCLTYLSFNVFKSGPCGDGEAVKQRLQDHQFLDYASRHWGIHVKEQDPERMSLTLSYLQDKEKLSSSIQILYVTSRKAKDWFDRYPKQFGPLHIAAYWGLENVMDVLLETEIDVDARDSYGVTALLTAAAKGNFEAVKILLENGADTNAQNKHGETALHWATKGGHKSVAWLLLEKGANIIVDDENWTALNWAVVNGDVELITKLMEQCRDLDAESEIQEKALFLAAEEGQEAILQKLLDSGVNVNARDEWGSTALDFAVSGGHKETVRTLLRNGANVNSTDKYENSALHWSVTKEEITRLLLEGGARVQAENDTGQTALCWTAQGGTVPVARLLLEHNANINWQDKKGSTALHKASLRGSDSMVRMLLEHDANVNLKDVDDWTPLHAACVGGHVEVIQLLSHRINGGSAVMDLVRNQMQNAKQRALLMKMAEEKGKGSTVLTGLRFAAQEGQVGRLQVLLENGADVNGKDAAGYTALELAAFQGHEEATQLLLEHGADINLLGSDNCPPLFFAIQQHNEGVVSMLIEHGADVNASVYGSTLLMLAAEVGHYGIAQDLIIAGAELDARDYSQRTALHWAAIYGREDIVRLLLIKGADLDSRDDRGITALMLAVENLQLAVAKLLIDEGASVKLSNHDGHSVFHIADIIGDRAMIDFLRQRGANPDSETDRATSPSVSLLFKIK